MLQMCLKCPHFWSKHVWNSISAPDWPQYDIPEITPHEGGQTRSTPRKTEIPNMALEFVRQMQFNSMVETEFPVKIWARSNPFKGCFELIFLLMVPSLHALPIHVFWAWYVFLNEIHYLLLFLWCPLSPKIWFTASLLPYWSKYEQILRHPPEGELQASWGPYTTPVITAILDVILKPMQSDLVAYRLFSCQISEL